MTTPALTHATIRPRRSIASYVMPMLAATLVGILVVWLAVNFYRGPAYFITIGFIGLTNGAVYALVALGYTLVYGILELINFAHGDVFMLGGMFSATMILSSSSSSRSRWQWPRAASSTRRSSESPTGHYAARLDWRR